MVVQIHQTITSENLTISFKKIYTHFIFTILSFHFFHFFTNTKINFSNNKNNFKSRLSTWVNDVKNIY